MYNNKLSDRLALYAIVAYHIFYNVFICVNAFNNGWGWQFILLFAILNILVFLGLPKRNNINMKGDEYNDDRE